MTKLFTSVPGFTNRRREKKEAEYNVIKCSFLMDGTSSVREFAIDRRNDFEKSKAKFSLKVPKLVKTLQKMFCFLENTKRLACKSSTGGNFKNQISCTVFSRSP
jgi:hypothetical protein